MKQFILFLIVVLLGFNSTIAQNKARIIEQKTPAINGHKFLSTNQLRSPIISTNLETNVGFGTTSVIKIPGIDIGDQNVFSFQGRIFYVDFNLEYQQKFTSWLSLLISIKMAGRLGSDVSTMIADGVNTVSGGNIGWLIKLKETEKFYLSGSIRASNITGSFINVGEYLQDVLSGNPYPSLSKKTPASTVGVGIRGAYAFNPIYGLQFNTEVFHGESLHRETTGTYYKFSLLGDVDFNESHDVPIALALGYSLSSTPEVSMDNNGFSSLYEGKIGYSGSSDFELGAQFTFYKIDLTTVESTTAISKIMLGLKFYF